MKKSLILAVKRNPVILTLLCIIAILIFLYVYEALLGVICPDISVHRSGWHEGRFYTWGQEVMVNRYGFRERDFESPKPEGIFRIAVLGDSFTWGTGLAEQDRFTNIVQSELNQKYPESKFEVLNFGMGGVGITFQRDILRTLKGIIQPDLIVIGFCYNDVLIRAEVLKQETLDTLKHFTYGICSRFKLPLLGLQLFNLSCRISEKIRRIPPWFQQVRKAYDINSDSWNHFVNALEEIKVMSDQMNLAPPLFVVLNHGFYPKIRSDYRNPNKIVREYLNFCHQAEAAAWTIGFKTYNHEKEISQGLGERELSLNIFDNHPSKALNEVYARKLLRVIIQEYIINKP